MEEIKSNSEPLLSAKSAFLFFASVMLVYFIAGVFIQTSLGLLGIFLNQILLVGLPVALVSYAKGIDLFHWPLWKWPGFKAVFFYFAWNFDFIFWHRSTHHSARQTFSTASTNRNVF